jgi:hypothetical protein
MLGDLYWAHNQPLVYEAMDIFEAAAFNPSNEDIRMMIYELFAGASDTKRVLEDTLLPGLL